MTVSAPGDIPEGWIQFPDGSIGPPQAPGVPTPGGGVTGGGAPGTSINNTGPQIIPPNAGVAPNKQVGAFTGGTSTEGNYWDPRNWFKGGQTFNAGEPMTRGQMNPLGFAGRGNPYWRSAIAAGGVLSPTPTANDAAPTDAWFQRPSGQGGMPGPQATPFVQPQHPSTMRFPGWPTASVADPAATINPSTDTSPYTQPSRPVTPTPPPGAATPGPINGRINPASVNLGNNPWTTMSRPNMSPQNSAQGTQGAPQMGMLDLSQIFNHPAVAAAAAQHPAVQAAAAQMPDLAQRVPLQNTPMPPPRPKGFGIPFLGELGGQGTST